MGIDFYWIDSFANQAFQGNPAGVCLLQSPIDDLKMQNIAREIGLSETAFVTKNFSHFELRWFTPTVEVDLCGHATLASAHALWESKIATSESIAFHTKSGMLTAKKDSEYVVLDFPTIAIKPLHSPIKNLLESLGINDPLYIGRSDKTVLIEVTSEKCLKNIQPDFELLKEVPIEGVVVTSRSEYPDDYDFVSRYFGPREGINEDPVTGFAHCHLGPYWQTKLNKTKFLAYQASSRGGFIKIDMHDDRILLGGKAITIMKGEISNKLL